MDTNKLWGFILVGFGVLFVLWGISSLWAAYTFADAMSNYGAAMGQLGNGEHAAQLSSQFNALAPSKFPGFILLFLGGGAAFFGTKLLKKAELNK